MILIVRGRDVHTVRLQQSLHSLNKAYTIVTSPEEITNGRYDIAFVDPSFKFDISSKLKADKIVFYDCEDSPTDFYPDVAYHTLKCDRYVKMNYIDDDRKDGIQNIAFPLPVYPYLAKLAQKISGIRNATDYFIPTFIGSPTFIGNYTTPYKVINRNGAIKVLSDSNMYNQRFDWVKSLRSYYNDLYNNVLGIVFSSDNLTIEYHREHFGEVDSLSVPRIRYQELLTINALNKISLSPTGHERLSWRIFDIMAAGSILLITDFGEQKSFYMPKEYLKIQDDQDISDVLSNLTIQDLKDLYAASKSNQDFIAALTPEKIWSDFIKLLNY